MTAVRALDMASIIKSYLDRGMDGYYLSAHLTPDNGPSIDLVAADPRASSEVVRSQMPASFTLRVVVAPLSAQIAPAPAPKKLSRRGYKKANRSAELSRCGTTIQEGNQIPTSPFISVT